MNSTIGTIIAVIIVVSWVVKGLASLKGEDAENKQGRGRSLEEWDQIQAQRREAARRQQQQGTPEVRADVSQPDPSQMTMAERIELARQRARQQAAQQNMSTEQVQAMRRARAQAEQQARQQRDQAAQQQRAQRERAAREQQARREHERAQQQRRRQAQQQAEQEAQAQRRRRTTKQQRRTQPARKARATTGSNREGVVAKSMQRIHQGHEHAGPVTKKPASPTQSIGKATAIGSLDRDSLRKAFIMKELLDKPLALRDPQAELYS